MTITPLWRRLADAWMAYWRDVAAATPRRHLASSEEFLQAHDAAAPERAS